MSADWGLIRIDNSTVRSMEVPDTGLHLYFESRRELYGRESTSFQTGRVSSQR